MSTTTPPSGSIRLTYVGGPTAVLEYAGLRLVTDPTFDPPGAYAEPGSTTLVKTAGPAIARGELGAVDAVLLSHHAHRDNLDWEGLELLATGVPTLSTMDAANDLFGGAVVGLDSWETHSLGPVTVTAVPALHGPPGSERLVGEVTGFVLEAEGWPTVYVSGDNASVPLVEQIASRFRVEVAVLFAGAARVPSIDGALTLTAIDATRAADALGRPRVVALHVEDWEHFSEGRGELAAAFADAGLDELLVETPRGEVVTL